MVIKGRVKEETKLLPILQSSIDSEQFEIPFQILPCFLMALPEEFSHFGGFNEN
jgi:hypothetical protein